LALEYPFYAQKDAFKKKGSAVKWLAFLRLPSLSSRLRGIYIGLTMSIEPINLNNKEGSMSNRFLQTMSHLSWLGAVLVASLIMATPSSAAETGSPVIAFAQPSYGATPEPSRVPTARRPKIQVLEAPFGGTVGFAGPGDVTANPAPGRPGAYTQVCTHDYNLTNACRTKLTN
jgi:hypothetical protein